MEDSYWTHDTFLFHGTFQYYRQESRPVRGKLHVSEESYDATSSLEREYLTLTRGRRSYVHLQPYVIEPELVIGVALSPKTAKQYADTPESIGTTTGTRVTGYRDRQIGNAQAWYYPEDRLLVLWECLLDEFVRDVPLREDTHMSALWTGFEGWLRKRYPQAERLVTPWMDPIWIPEEYQTFLTARGYTNDKPGLFTKLLR